MDEVKKIQDFIEKTGISVAKLARRLGIGRSTLHRYLAGTSSPNSIIFKEKINKVCDLSNFESHDSE